MRAAIYFTPPPSHALTKAAASWLGRDAFTGERFAAAGEADLSGADVARFTAEPRRYGFHATVKAPFHLAEGVALGDLSEALRAFCAKTPRIGAVSLRLTTIGSFLALTTDVPDRAIGDLAAQAVAAFEPFRAPLTEGEIAKRRPQALTADQRHNLMRWGYPHVFEEFRFHLTLTGPIAAADRLKAFAALQHRFAAAISEPIEIDTLALFVQPSMPADFTVYARYPLRAKAPPEGVLVLVVGPSGAGKDTLLKYAAEKLRDHSDFSFVRRTITRPSAIGSEDHDTETEGNFQRRLAEGAFALSWQAHGLSYGLPRMIDRAIADGQVVIANVSRNLVAEARRKYPRTVVVNVTASEAVLAQRLRARGRESEASIAARLRRADAHPLQDGVLIDNSSTIGEAGDKFVAVLRQIPQGMDPAAPYGRRR
jgi:phosphonate metabolism protein PhnN/1,5-bisphosphokinase (PRPP-forming)